MDRADLREIDHDRWVPFLAEFSKAHDGEPVRVRLRETAGVADAAGERIDVTVKPEEAVAHVTSHPIHVRVSDPAGHRPLVVQIDAADGSTTLLKFLSGNAGVA